MDLTEYLDGVDRKKILGHRGMVGRWKGALAFQRLIMNPSLQRGRIELGDSENDYTGLTSYKPMGSSKRTRHLPSSKSVAMKEKSSDLILVPSLATM